MCDAIDSPQDSVVKYQYEGGRVDRKKFFINHVYSLY